MGGRRLLWAVAILTFAADQGSKAWVRENLDLYESWAPIPALARYFTFTHVTNTGVAFGLFREWGSVLVALAVVIIAFLLLYTRQLATARWPVQIALGLQLGGAFGNLIDRLRFGFVTDFLDFKFWPVFNLADSAIVVGMVLLFLFLEEGKGRAPAASSPPEDPGRNP